MNTNKMSLWCDKYRPKRLDDMDFNQQQANQLKCFITSDNFPHLCIYGPSGSGKKTRIDALLYELYGASARKIRLESKVVEAPSGKRVEQHFTVSNYHMVVNPSENGFYDRIVIQELIKDMATASSLSKKFPFKVIVITEADRLTREAQQGLRRTLEKYVSTCRVILVAERISCLIPALRSRCFTMRNAAPSMEIIRDILVKTINIEEEGATRGHAKIDAAISKVVEQCDRNLRRALNMLQEFYYSNKSVSDKNKKGPDCGFHYRWYEMICTLAKKLAESQSVRKVPEIRAILFALQVHLIPPELVLRMLTNKLMDYCLDDQMSHQLLRIAATVDHRLALGSKSIIHLELFCIQFMTMFRCSVEKVSFDLDEAIEID